MLRNITISFFVLSFIVGCQQDIHGINYKSLVKTYADGSWESWKSEITNAEKAKPSSIESKLAIINLYYGYIGHIIESQNQGILFEYIYKAEVLIKEILAYEPSNVTALSYKGAFLGFRATTNRIKYLGSALEGLSIIYKAYDLDRNNLIAVINKASALYFLPPVFGGSKIEASKLLNKARTMMEASNLTTDNWMYLYTLIFLARSYEKSSRNAEAKNTYEKVLQIEPEFKWVKLELYPEVLNAVNQK